MRRGIGPIMLLLWLLATLSSACGGGASAQSGDQSGAEDNSVEVERDGESDLPRSDQHSGDQMSIDAAEFDRSGPETSDSSSDQPAPPDAAPQPDLANDDALDALSGSDTLDLSDQEQDQLSDLDPADGDDLSKDLGPDGVDWIDETDQRDAADIADSRDSADSEPGDDADDAGGDDADDAGGDVEPDAPDMNGIGACPPRAELKTLATGRWAYELIPNVVRDDGSDSLVLEVFVNQPDVKLVRLVGISFLFKGPGSGTSVELKDDGLGPDRIAADGIYTAGPYNWDANSPVKIGNLYNDSESPAGLDFHNLGRIELVKSDDSVQQFLQQPVVGVLRSDQPLPAITALGDGIAATSHLLNICGTQFQVQNRLRYLAGPASSLIKRAYTRLQDLHQFIALVSTYKVERIGHHASNFNAGLYGRVRNSVTGINVSQIDNGATYGSNKELLGLLTLDLAKRGLNAANLAHEILHNWSGWVSTGGISDGVHFSQHSSVGSLLGGFLWVQQPDGSFIRDCSEGRNKGHRASPLDRYLMGLIGGDQVPSILIATDETGVDCTGTGPPKPYAEVTIEQIQAQYGVRSPGPDTSPKSFRIAFVAESLGRMLSPTEMAFYTILAAHVSKSVPQNDPDPYVQQLGWVPIERFFGHGTTWATGLKLKTQ